ncbi:MAG TPA: hypothetical protein VGP19_10980 [Candidatus Acidoferrales bacterium]|jgi:hypothetical protein|nr:hypothetical protein [Candidatus Acidoferrales bacterium]
MRRNLLFLICPFVFLAWQENVWAQQVVVPAGTLLRCTLNEPNFSSATAEVGDPIVCHVGATQQFGREALPRDTYLAGHLEAYKDPGHFVGKGWLQLSLDRIGLPNTQLPVPAKVIAVSGYRVDREGKIRGRGHAERDAVEWMLPPLWPWKVLTLPARGSRPTLKGEVEITLRLMEDVTLPQMSAAVSRTPGPPRAESSTPTTTPSIWYVPPGMSGLRSTVAGDSVKPAAASGTEPRVLDIEGTRITSTSQRAVSPAAQLNSPQQRQPSGLTLIALKSEAIYAVTDYWLDNGRLNYALSSGTDQSVDLAEIDWGKTLGLNAERGVTVTLRSGRYADQQSHPAL